jgi:uncharacterized protein (TIGR02145 family)
MKQLLLLLLTILSLIFSTYAQNVGIGTSSPSSSAKLDINSTTQGFLPPRMTEAQRNAIISPALGLAIFNTSTNCLNIYVGKSWNEICGTISYPAGTVNCIATTTEIVDVTNPITGKTWMDRNLGASRAASSSSDVNSYGDLYQWGRSADGHQCRNSATSNVLSIVDQPAQGRFIISINEPWDWRSPQNNTLWQGNNSVNNPCPSGYRLPTEVEWNEERLSWSSNNSAGAFASPLKLTRPGYRDHISAALADVGFSGFYWSSTVNGISASRLYLLSNNAQIITTYRSFGGSVRCIKD